MSVTDAFPAVTAFETRRRRMLRRGRIEAAAYLVALSVLLVLALHVSETFSGEYGAAPFERAATFLARMDPHLQPANLLGASDSEGSLAYWFYGFPKWARALMISLEMAAVATVAGGVLAFGASLLMARTLMPSMIVRLGVRRVLDVLRTFPDFILALLLVQAVGVGPMAGVLAMTVTTLAGLARPFAEASENADPRPLESVRAAGGGWLRQIRYGLLPYVAPNMLSLIFVIGEFNISRATALGIVGAGGIGAELSAALSYNQFDTYLAILLMIVAMIMASDLVSEQVRHRLFGLGAAR